MESKELASLEKEYGIVLDQIDIFEKIKDNLRTRIILQFETLYGHQGAKYENLETGGILQRVIQVRDSADSDEVKKLIPNQWNMIKKEVVDMPKLISAIKLGVINPIPFQDVIKTTEIDKISWKKGK